MGVRDFRQKTAPLVFPQQTAAVVLLVMRSSRFFLLWHTALGCGSATCTQKLSRTTQLFGL